MTPNTTYWLRVRSFNAEDVGSGYSYAAAITLANEPAGLTITGVHLSSISVSWAANGNPAGTRYEISISTDNFAINFSTPISVYDGLTSLAASIPNLQDYTTYWVRVRSYNSNGIQSDFSNIASTITLYHIAYAQINGTGPLEEAWDQDHNPANGYEYYVSSGLASTATVTIDGDSDGKYDFFISTAGDYLPEIYWDPDNGIISIISVVDINGDGHVDYVYDSNGDGILDSYYNTATNVIVHGIPCTQTVQNIPGTFIDFDGNPSNGYETYIDPSGQTSVVKSLDVDGDGKLDFLIDTNKDGVPDRYCDPDNGISTAIILRDFDGDGVMDWGIDLNGDGRADKYYNPARGILLSVLDIVESNGYPVVPNPFKPAAGSAVVVFDMIKAGEVVIDIYDIAGEKVAVLVHGYRGIGRHQVKWNGGNGEWNASDGDTVGNISNKLASGIYIIRYKFPDKTVMKKIAVVR